MTKKDWSARTKHDLIIEVWEYLDCESVGARELEEIQQALGEKLAQARCKSGVDRPDSRRRRCGVATS